MLLRANKHLQPAGGLTILPDTAGCPAAAREQRQDVGGSTLSARPRAAQTGDFPLDMNQAGRRSRGAVIFREAWAWQKPRPAGFWGSTRELFARGNLPMNRNVGRASCLPAAAQPPVWLARERSLGRQDACPTSGEISHGPGHQPDRASTSRIKASGVIGCGLWPECFSAAKWASSVTMVSPPAGWRCLFARSNIHRSL